MKLKRLRIQNYKALDDVEIDVPGNLLFVIGVNGAGKTSALQALSLARYFAEGQTPRFFKDRHWSPSEVRPRTVNVTPLRAASNPQSVRRIPARNLGIALVLEDKRGTLLWEFVWSYSSERTTRESIWMLGSQSREPRRLFGFPAEDDLRGQKSETLFKFDDFRLPGSILSLVSPGAISANDEDAAILADLRDWAKGIASLELLSPDAMRGGVRGSYSDIGPRGERLAGFLAALPVVAKDRILTRMSDFYPVRSLDTTRKRAGWIDMKIAESFRFLGRIDVGHMSDGFLRILALCSIPEFGDFVSLVLLDEVEDGIEPHILPKLIDRIARESRAQIIATTHSPLLINYFDPAQTYLLSRDREGRTVGAKIANLPLFRDGQDFLGSGEIWANSQRAAIQDSVRAVRVRRRHDLSSGHMSEVLRLMRNP